MPGPIQEPGGQASSEDDVTSGDIPEDLLRRHYARLDSDPEFQRNVRWVHEQLMRAASQRARQSLP